MFEDVFFFFFFLPCDLSVVVLLSTDAAISNGWSQHVAIPEYERNVCSTRVEVVKS
jgi:hypothetical protein